MSYQERFNARLYEPGRLTWAHRHLPERVRMWSPFWLRHVVAVERTLHQRTMDEARDAWAAPCRSCAGCERELSAVRLDLISALGQAQEHQERANTAYDALREIETILRNPMPDDHKLDAIGAIVSNGPLDTAPGGPREDECARLIAERDQYRDALEQIADREPHDSSQPAQAHALAVARVHARAALSRERKDTNA